MQRVDEDTSYRSARKRMETRQACLVHAAVFIVVNAGLAGFNLVASPGYLWFLWILGGWGIALVAHAVLAFRK